MIITRLIFAMGVLLLVTPSKAHQPDISSMTLIEREAGHWVVNLNSSVEAFQHEVKNRFGEDSYTCKEEFNELLLKHLRGHIKISINDHDVIMTKGFVNLGHATTVMFELSGVPDHVEKVFIKNEAFKNIRQSQGIFRIVKEGFDKEKFVISHGNDYQINLSLEDNQVLLAETPSISYWNFMLLFFLLAIVGLIGSNLFKKGVLKEKLKRYFGLIVCQKSLDT